MTMRDDNSFDSLHRSAEEQVTQMKLDAIHLVRQSRPSMRLNQGGAAAAAHTVFNTSASYIKPAYLMAIGTEVVFPQYHNTEKAQQRSSLPHLSGFSNVYTDSKCDCRLC
jgi:hypothetical protein